MNSPIRTSVVLLVADRRDEAQPGGSPIRRYRLARLRLQDHAAQPATRAE